MTAALHRAAKTGTGTRSPLRSLRSGAHASRWAADEPARARQSPRPRIERRARRSPPAGATRIGPSCLYGYDAHGNIAFLADASGAETDTYTYDAWGNLVGRTGSTLNSRLYVGEELDPDLGLINLRARQYKPETGRFMTLDPAHGSAIRPRTWNRYLLAGADPVNWTDRNGQLAVEEADMLFLGAAAIIVAEAHVTKDEDWAAVADCTAYAALAGGIYAALGGPLAIGTYSFYFLAYCTVIYAQNH